MSDIPRSNGRDGFWLLFGGAPAMARGQTCTPSKYQAVSRETTAHANMRF